MLVTKCVTLQPIVMEPVDRIFHGTMQHLSWSLPEQSKGSLNSLTYV